MGFSIGYDFGALGGLAIGILIAVGGIVAVFLLTSAKRARDDIVEQEGDDPDIVA